MTTEIQPTEILPPSAIESISRAEIDVAIATARRFPRQLSTVKKNMLSFATLDQETAESCFYTLPRGGKNIQGPSVRLAEIAVSSYGNLRAGTRILQTVSTGDNPHVVVQAVAMDLENNIQVSIEKRRRITKKKSKDAIDEDDINLAANAGSAIAFRDAVFKIVPMALIKPVYEQAKQVAIGDAKTLGDRRQRCLEAFGKMGVNKERLLARIAKKDMDDITLEDVELLLGLHNAIKDGEASIDEAFPAVVKKPEFPTPPTPTPQAPSTERKRRTQIDNVVQATPPPAEPSNEGDLAPTVEAAPEKSFEEVVDGADPAEQPNPLGKLQAAIAAAKIDENYAIAESKTVAYFAAHNLLQEGQPKVLRSVIPGKIESIIKMLPHMAGQIKEMGA